MGIFDWLRGLITRVRDEDPPPRTGDPDPDRPGVGESGAGTSGGGSGPGRPGPARPTDRGQVLRLLVRNDGSMRRSALIEEIDLGEDETLRVLSEMEDDDDVRLVPYGKEILVCRPGYEPPGQRKL